ncbi:MAG: hypothetical protein JXR79_02935 [Nitrospirae bacterium]|nr:hypothetical protein [Nitrospirota bacterium]
MKIVYCFVAAALLLALSCSAYAQSSDKDAGFEDLKAKKLMNINSRIAVLEAERECIINSNSSQDINKCKNEAFQKRLDMVIEPKQQKK